MQKKYWLVLIIPILFNACSTAPTAQEIVDSAILAHGGKTFDKFQVDFDFRDKHYTAIRKGGEFTYIRAFTDSTGTYRDVLNNTGFTRHRNDTLQSLTDEKRKAFTNSVNSVIYFALLPFGLNDPAVVKELVGEEEVKGKRYFVIKVSFKQEGGGADFEDEFLYWIKSENYTVDYLAYSYHTNGGGIRFREAVNPQNVGGILWQDYINYKPADEKGTSLLQLMPMFKEGKLVELSSIELKNMQVSTDLN
ncbi:hypothetical protein SanaruYs_17600 [Chryseotalea sanaruensis]|uniref:Deoxyribose-phosphate aldolase n=1 Tax=Chryseotalea sanaruensis TaxID=2482724 RepID=A0A401U9H4_9BACT|nr:DUF6503 family protein [Chryseotalea sanaruensis]GCC51535.1 hypothetical protein SanaruYs_17600 [Chryseotalea sanaruensis]